MGERALRTALAGVSAFALGYLLPGTLRLPTLAYDPVQRTLSLQRVLAGVQMRYFSDLLIASCAGLVSAAIAHRLFRSGRRGDLPVAAGIAASLVALDLANYLSRLLAAV